MQAEIQIGKEYQNSGGGTFRAMSVTENGNVVFRNIRTGWELVAHGTVIHDDGKIEWDYSTDGHWT